MDVILVLEFSTLGLDFLIEAARKRNIGIVLLTSDRSKYFYVLSNTKTDNLKIEILKEFSLNEIIQKISNIKIKNRVLGIVNPPDIYFELFLKVCNHFSFRTTNQNAIEIVRNKNRLRELCSSHLLTPIKSSLVNQKDLLSLLKDPYPFEYPFILKNNSGTCGSDVYIIRNKQELSAAVNSSRVKNVKNYLIEEFLNGPLFSAECLTFNNKTQILGISSRVLSHHPDVMELSYSFPIAFPSDLYKKIENYIEQLHRLIGFDYGFSHTEFILTAQGPVVVEINPRMGGGGMGYIISESFNKNVYEAYIDVILNEPPFINAKMLQGGAAIFLYATTPGQYLGYEAETIISQENIVTKIYPLLEPGAVFKDIKSFDSCYAILQCIAPTAELAYYWAMDAANKVNLKVRNI